MQLKQNYYLFLILVTLMSSVSIFATDTYLPALPDMALHFNCTQTEIQLSFTVFLLGLAGSQLIVGALSDRFGRKKIVISGFVLFTLSSILCANAHTLSQFIIFRLLQAIGGGVGSVTSRALVVDRYNRQESVKIFSTIFPIVGSSAAIAPFIGGYLTTFFGWRSNFFMIAIFGLIILFCVFLCLKNKVPSASTKHPPTSKKQGYSDVLGNLEFLGYALIIAAGFCVFRSYSVETPFVFSRQGYAPEKMGQFYIALAVAYIVGNLFAKKLINKWTVEYVLRVGFSFFIVGGLCMVSSLLIFDNNPYGLIVPMAVITFGNGLLFPVASAAAMTSVRSEHYGIASGLLGAIQCVLAAFCSNWVGELCQGRAVSLSLFIGTLILVGFLSYLLLIVYKPKSDVSLTEDI
ncbi:MAG TPA: multidrug effflux MFS transporter [Gammaproteobacteria bacterium]|nr:multidrug effflux MFS transporter [Gammaproteobacteria bacterium]